MTSRTRLWVLLISTPIIAFAIIGGYLGQAMTKDDTYQHLRVFEDVVSLVLNNYVEEVNVDKVMHGAMHGLADGLDPDSAYLDINQVKVLDKGDLDAAYAYLSPASKAARSTSLVRTPPISTMTRASVL